MTVKPCLDDIMKVLVQPIYIQFLPDKSSFHMNILQIVVELYCKLSYYFFVNDFCLNESETRRVSFELIYPAIIFYNCITLKVLSISLYWQSLLPALNLMLMITEYCPVWNLTPYTEKKSSTPWSEVATTIERDDLLINLIRAGYTLSTTVSQHWI